MRSRTFILGSMLALGVLGTVGCSPTDTSSNSLSFTADESTSSAPTSAEDSAPSPTSSAASTSPKAPSFDFNFEINGKDISCEQLTKQSDCAERIQDAIRQWSQDPRIQRQLDEYINSQLANSELFKGCEFVPKTEAEKSQDAERPSLQDRIDWPGHDKDDDQTSGWPGSASKLDCSKR